VADEARGKKKRGRKRGGRRTAPGQERLHQDAPEPQDGGGLEVAEESVAPSATGPRFSLRRRSRGEGASGSGPQRSKSARPAAAGAAAASGEISPMDFWRTGAQRTYRPAAGAPRKGLTWQRRITGLYLPPWVPVVAIIAVVFGILGLLFIVRSATGAPRIGDHWHAPYTFHVCGLRQPNAPEWPGGVHTHQDGILHIHPLQAFEEGSGARLVKWFEYGGGRLTNDEIRMPGSNTTHRTGDTCPDGREAELQVYVTPAGGSERRIQDRELERYIPQDGDRIRIVFGPPEEVVQLEDRTVIPEGLATREIEVVVTDDGTEAGTEFQPASIQVDQNEVVKLIIRNEGEISHGFRVAGNDGQFETVDDYVSEPEIIQPGEQGVAVIRLDQQGEVTFRDETLQDITGTIVVREGAAATPTPAPEDEVAADVELEMSMKDNFFEPAELTVRAGETFRILLRNEGPQFVHNLRITGPDGEFDTEDDLVSEPLAQRVGFEGELVGKIDRPGAYAFKCDFHPLEMAGTLTVE
jgi:plastocyanin